MIKRMTMKASIVMTALIFSFGLSITAEASTSVSDRGIAGITLALDSYYIATADQERGEAEELLEALAVQNHNQSVDGEVTEVVSPYANLGISIASNYVNIRLEPNTESEIVGKLYKGCATDILEWADEWVKIESGNVCGYINAEFLAIGEDAEALVEEYASKYATITTETLFVREDQSTESSVINMVPGGETFYIIKEYDNWVEIMIDEEDSGFVSKDYIDITVEFEYAISIEEENARIAAEEAAKQAEAERLQKLAEQQEAARKAEEARKAAAEAAAKTSNSNNNSTTSSSNTSSSLVSSSSTGQEIADYAVKFVGNPYVWGGTSLTKGADCSGFVQSIYAHFGISITRTSRDQAASSGVEVSISSLQPGDLIFYRNSSGVVNHVALYIGNGKVVHASNAREGIKISSYNYRTPYRARRIIK